MFIYIKAFDLHDFFYISNSTEVLPKNKQLKNAQY